MAFYDTCTGRRSLSADVEAAGSNRAIPPGGRSGCGVPGDLPSRKCRRTARKRKDLMSPEALIGMELGNSVLQRLLGQGTMGTVYLATRADQQVALKVFLPASPLAEAEHEEFLRRLEEIIARNASLDHPHILGVLQHGRQKQLVYQITPYIAGVSLETAFARVQSLPFVQIQHYLEQLA